MRKRLKYNLLLFVLLQMCYVFLYLPNHLIAQTTNEDSLKFLKQINDLSSKKQYASIQYLLESRLQEVGLKPYWACRMVQNGLQNFASQQLYKIFYLRNEATLLARSILLEAFIHPSHFSNHLPQLPAWIAAMANSAGKTNQTIGYLLR